MLSRFPRLARTLAVAGALATGIAAQAASFVLAYTDGQVPASYSNLQQFYGHLNAVGLGSTYSLTSSGSVSTEGMNPTTQSIIAFAKARALPLYPTVSDYSNAYGGFDPAVSNTVLASAANRTKAVNNLVSLTTANGFAGVNVDLEAVQPAQKANYNAFLSALASALRVHGLKLIVSVPAKTSDNGAAYLAGFDYAGIGSVADYVQVMTYDEVGPGWSSRSANGNTWPGPESGLDWQRTVLTYAASRIQASKVLSGLPSYGYDYSTGQLVHWADFEKVIASHAGAVLGRDTAAGTPWARWGTVRQQPDGTSWSTSTRQPVLWYDDAQSVQAKVGLVASLGLGGTSVWAMGYENAAFWTALKAGLPSTSTPTPTPTPSPATDGNIERSGTGYVWARNTTATANTNRSARAAVNDGVLSAGSAINPGGEGGVVRWQAAGVVFATPRTVSSVRFVNGTIDSYGNGFFQGGVALQFSTDGQTWSNAGWTLSPGYPNSLSAAGATYTFSGAVRSGVVGVRVVGSTGDSSWSGTVNEVQVIGR